MSVEGPQEHSQGNEVQGLRRVNGAMLEAKEGPK